MDYFFQKIGWKRPVAWMIGLAVVCLGLAGCSKINNLRGDGFHDNTMGDEIRESQPAQKETPGILEL